MPRHPFRDNRLDLSRYRPTTSIRERTGTVSESVRRWNNPRQPALKSPGNFGFCSRSHRENMKVSAMQQTRTTYRGLGYPVHVLDPQDGCQPTCKCSVVVHAVRVEDALSVPISVLCPECRKLLGRRNKEGGSEFPM